MSPQLKFLRFCLVAAVLALIAGSLTPRDYIPPHSVEDKLLHFVGYATVSMLAVFAIRNRTRRYFVLFVITALGVALEFAQLQVPGRAFEAWDMVANTAGVAAGACMRLIATCLGTMRDRKPIADGSSPA